jgi:hypothetical protein
MLPDRKTRFLEEHEESFHRGDGGARWRVWTEYGGDAWRHAAMAGFAEVRLVMLEYPAAIAFTCVK